MIAYPASAPIAKYQRKADVLLRGLNEALRPPRLLLEIGCMRFMPGSFEALIDGSSTGVLARWAHENGATFISIDNAKESLTLAEKELARDSLSCRFVFADGWRAINKLRISPDFLFLDGADDPEQALWQLKACPRLPDTVVVDDCNPSGTDDPLALGKGSRVIPWALNNGYVSEACETWFDFMCILRKETA